MKPIHIIIMAKAPTAGLAKTRLIPALGAQGAAELAQKMLMHTVNEAIKSEIGVVELCMTPDHDGWQSVEIPKGVICTYQGDGDLGERMKRASQRAIVAGHSLVLIGSDCPDLDAAQLRLSAEALAQSDAVIIPATDGGYVLLGFNRYDVSLFENMIWSTSHVFEHTLQRLNLLGWRVAQMPPLSDIDTPDDLFNLPPSMKVRITHAPR